MSPTTIRGRSPIYRVPGVITNGLYTLTALAAAWGLDYNQTTGTAYVGTTSRLELLSHFVLESLLWDIKNSYTYKIAFVASLTWGSADVYVLNNSVALTGGLENSIALDNGPVLLLPGVYFIRLSTATSATMWRDGVADNTVSGSLVFRGTQYSNNSYYSGEQPGMKFVGKAISISGLSNYATPAPF